MTEHLDDVDILCKISIKDIGKLKRYLDLSLKDVLEDNDDIDFISKLLNESVSDEKLAFFIDKIDSSISLGKSQDLAAIEKYEQKQPWLSEYLTCVDPEFHLRLQKKLSLKKYYDGPLDGILGKETKKAIKKFKSAKHIEEDAVLGPETVRQLLTVS